MLEKIPANVSEDSGECSRRFRGIKISIYFVSFLSNFAVKLLQKMKKKKKKKQLLSNSSEENISYLRLISNLLSSSTVFLNYLFLSFFVLE